ncbi:B3 domain-containing protein Os03g0212300-like [Olea europaea var. sylvestris]|uniref:B3 domain-containing protein Os03g0212300-like n=1 Tax=Olea europaea var. sylvestris TaxID=158386 RepID=UPI000C1D5ADE|nr:B3 domain-containing protein Os03g0212300-like [Olea europaea var. sylvestris]
MDIPRRFYITISNSLNHGISLMMPRSFAKHWRHEFDDTVRVIAYDGIFATIGLEEVRGKIYLTHGWEQFFDRHNLDDGYCLIFEYTENFTFNITIIDDFGLEVKYDSDVPEESEESNNSNTYSPVFEVKLTPRLHSHQKIYVLGRFARQHLPKFLHSVQIYDSLHRNWDITTNLRPNSEIHCLTIGWVHFLSFKELQMGDTCVLLILVCSDNVF